MISVYIITLVLISLVTNQVKADFYCSIVQYQPLIESHKSFIDSMEAFLYDEERRMNKIRKYLRVYKYEHKRTENVPDYLNNPINAFTHVKRLTTDLAIIQNIINIAAKLQVKEEMKYPTTDDLDGAAIGIARVQDTYNLNIEDLASGIIRGNYSRTNELYIERTTPMSASDCYEIAQVLYKRKFLFDSLQWWKQALYKYKCKAEDDGYPFDEVTIVRHIRDAYDEMDDITNALSWTNELLILKPNKTEAKNLITYQKKIANEKFWNKEIISKQILDRPATFTKEQQKAMPGGDETDYKALCRGEQQAIDYSLTCHYQTGSHPYLRLARVKTELLHRSPDIILYHDVISDAEIQTVQEIAKNLLKRFGVGNKHTRFEGRISKSANLFDDMSVVVARVSRRISFITNLSTEFSESLHTANYGIGGYYRPHYDYFGQPFTRVDTGDIFSERIATILFYLSDVEQGGATVFTRAKLTVFPEKGAALFWWNLHNSGDPDHRTEHAGCPVLLGSKWISTKWLHVEGQELRIPCQARRTNFTAWTLPFFNYLGVSTLKTFFG